MFDITHRLKTCSKLITPAVKRPAYLLLFVTNRCDCQCGHCFYWEHINDNSYEMTVEEYESLAKGVGPLLQLTITGGSPDLREDIPEIVKIFAKHCHPGNVTYCTNGYNTDSIIGHTEKILLHNPSLNLTVDISLDALGDQLDKIRNRKGLFDKVCDTYKELGRLRKLHPHRLRIGCGICISGLNCGTAVETAVWALEKLPLDNLTPILVRGTPRNMEAANTDVKVFEKIAGMAEKRLMNGQMKGYRLMSALINAKDMIQKRVIADIYRGRKYSFHCRAANSIAVVYPDGTIPGCELRHEILGNFREADYDFDRVWHGDSAAKFRRKIREEKCQCYHQCFLSVNMAGSYRMMALILLKALRIVCAKL